MSKVFCLLSEKEGIFQRICDDMKSAGYEIRSLVKEDAKNPRDYIVESERFGVPQTRHRVILLGVKEGSHIRSKILHEVKQTTLREALVGIPHPQ